MNNLPHKLYEIWSAMHQATQANDEVTWGQSYEQFNALLTHMGKMGALDEGVGEAIRLYSDQMQQDFIDEHDEEAMVDLLTVFHHDIISDLSSMYSKGSEEREEVLAHKVELFGIPMFGEHQALTSLHENLDFLTFLKTSGYFPSHADIFLFGAVAAEQASQMMMSPQVVYETLSQTNDMFQDQGQGTHAANFRENVVKNVQEQWDVLPKGEDTGRKLKVGGYVLLGAVHTKGDIDAIVAEEENILKQENDLTEKWEENCAKWAQTQAQSKKLALGTIHPPTNLRDATSAALAEFLFSALSLQGNMGGRNEAIFKRIEIVIPQQDVDENDMAHIYGYAENDMLLGGLQTNALAFGLLFHDVIEHWEQWAPDCTFAVVEMPPKEYLKQRTKQTFH